MWSCHDVGVDRIRLLEPLLEVKTILQAKLGAGCHIQVIKAEQGAKKKNLSGWDDVTEPIT